MQKLSALLQEVFADQTPLAAVGLSDDSLSGASKFSSVDDLPTGKSFAGALWTGPLEEAPAAALALQAAVKEGGVVLLLQIKGHGPLAVVRGWLSGGAARGDEAVERLCGALLRAGLARPALLVESASLTAALGRVRAASPSA